MPLAQSKLTLLILCVLILGGLISAPVLSNESATQLDVLQRNSDKNELKILDNRFRIDHEIEEITLLFFREPGSPAVILVRPDGSKIFATSSFRDKNVDWFDDETYDIVKIKNPMAGPWQAIGQILPESRLMILSEIELDVDPLPPLLFKGETIKLTGRLTNGGEPVTSGYFRDLVSLNVDFYSTNNKDYFNFNSDPVHVAEFKDDGQGYDERPGDAVFTGEFKLDFAAGEWRPEFELATPLVARHVVHDPLIIDEPPFVFTFAEAAEGETSHKVTIALDETKVKPETIVFQGSINYPNSEQQSFTIDALENDTRTLSLANYDWGVYSIDISVFGSNINGREFMAKLDRQEFEIERVIEKVPEIEKPDILLDEMPLEELPEEPAMDNATLISIIVIANVLILVIGGLFIRVVVLKKPLLGNFKFSLKKKQKQQDGESLTDAGRKSDSGDEILNLSMPDE